MNRRKCEKALKNVFAARQALSCFLGQPVLYCGVWVEGIFLTKHTTMENRFCTYCGTLLTGQGTCPHCGAVFGSNYERSDVPHRGAHSPPPHVSDYLVWSIISVLYAGVLGVVALVFSILCRCDLNAGRYDSATRYSDVAFWCNAIALGLFALGILCVFLFFVLLGSIAIIAG